MKAAEPYLRFHNIDPSTPFGKVAEGISEFATGFGVAGRALKAAGILQQGGVGATIAQPMVRGALADFNANAQEERLSNIIEDIPALRGPVTAWLAAGEDDGFLEGKVKNVIEGLTLGVAGDTLFASVKALRAIKSGKSMEEAARIVEAAQSPKVSAAIKDSSVPKAPEVNNVDMFIKQVHAAKSAEDAITGITDSVNFNRMVWESPQGSNALKNVSEALADKTLKAAGPEKHAALLREVVDDFSQAGVDLSAKAAKLREAGSYIEGDRQGVFSRTYAAGADDQRGNTACQPLSPGQCVSRGTGPSVHAGEEHAGFASGPGGCAYRQRQTAFLP